MKLKLCEGFSAKRVNSDFSVQDEELWPQDKIWLLRTGREGVPLDYSLPEGTYCDSTFKVEMIDFWTEMEPGDYEVGGQWN